MLKAELLRERHICDQFCTVGLAQPLRFSVLHFPPAPPWNVLFTTYFRDMDSTLTRPALEKDASNIRQPYDAVSQV